MKPRFVSAVAVLICGTICAIVAFFAYSRYTAAQAENAAFRDQLRTSTTNQDVTLGTHMPPQLPPRATSSEDAGGPSPSPAQQ